jgi:7-cyano-7-deazaguanine synthase
MKEKLAVVLLSGGMDSCVTAAIARQGHELALLHANYGQRTERRELRAFNDIAQYYQVPPHRRLVVDMKYLGAMGGSSLTDLRLEIPTECGIRNLECGISQSEIRNQQSAISYQLSAISYPQSEIPNPKSEILNPHSAFRNPHSQIPSTYVPFRNTHLLAVAVSWAEVLGARKVFIGAVEADSPGYPDCREVYYETFNQLIKVGTRPDSQITVSAPLLHLKKSEIVLRGMTLKAPLHLSWSCYKNEDRACGTCQSCRLRLEAFKEAGCVDCISYEAARLTATPP